MSYGETAVMIGLIAVPVLFSFHAYKILEYNNGDRWNQALSIFLILMSFVSVWSIVNVAQKIAIHGPAADVLGATDITYNVVIIGGVVVLAYFILRVLFNTLELAFKGGRL